MNTKLITKTFLYTLMASAYIFAVSLVMTNGEKWFGDNSPFAPFAVLMLFSLSAAIVGGLVFGQSVMLFFEGKKKDSVKAAVYSIGWLAVYTLITLLVLFSTHVPKTPIIQPL